MSRIIRRIVDGHRIYVVVGTDVTMLYATSRTRRRCPLEIQTWKLTGCTKRGYYKKMGGKHAYIRILDERIEAFARQAIARLTAKDKLKRKETQ